MASDPSRLKMIAWWAGGLSIVFFGLFDATALVKAEENESGSSIDQVDYVMYFDPEFPHAKRQLVVTGKPIPLWLDALARPDTELQRVTIDSMSIAHRRKMIGIEVVLPKLVELLGQSELDAQVRRAAVKALIEFDASGQAALLAELSIQHGAAITSLVEPALMRWKSPAMVDQWLERLGDPGVGRQSLIVAIAGLGAIENREASDPLWQFVSDPSLSTGIRLASARSLGLIHESGLTDRAAGLIGAAEPDVTSELLAIELLSRHADPKSIDLLKRLAAGENTNTIVKAESLKRLFEIDPNLVLGFADDAIVSKDVNVRRVIADALIWSKDVARIAAISTLLDDVNPGLRRQVADALVRLAQETDLEDEVISQVSGVLDQDSWRGCEQAALVLVNLDHKPAGDRLVDLMSHPRGEVMVTAGWGLRRLGLKKHLPAMLGRAQSIYDGFGKRKLLAGGNGPEYLMAQLFLAFGQMRYREADQLARAYVPRNFALGERARSAAAWSIGYLHEGTAPDDLVKMLLSRLNDVESMEPEFEDVRQMCAVALGRMNAEAGVADLRKHALAGVGFVSRACYWAIEKITGEEAPLPREPNPIDYHDWFLQPLDDDLSAAAQQ